MLKSPNRRLVAGRAGELVARRSATLYRAQALGGRIRRIKCDEGQPHCRKCTSTGRACDGYEPVSASCGAESQAAVVRLSQISTSDSTPITLDPNISPPLTANEARGFDFFRNKTTSEIRGAFRSSLWEQIVLQLSHQEPAILHAVVAVGIVHRDQTATQDARKKAFYHGLDRRQAAGLQQYVKAIGFLRTRIDAAGESGHARAREVALLSCLLFVCLEMLWGKNMSALTHLGTGLKILTSQGTHGLAGANSLVLKGDHGDLMDELASAFVRLDCESTMFGNRTPQLHVLPSQKDIGGAYIPLSFRSIDEARSYMDMLSNGMLRFRGKLLEITAASVSATALTPLSRYLWDHASTRSIELGKYPHLLEALKSLQESYASWASALDSFKSKERKHSEDQPRSLILLELQYFYGYLLLSTCQTTREMVCDSFNDHFSKVIRLVNRYLSSSTTTDSRPVFALDSGIIPALYLTAYKCRCPRLRREAISLMALAPCQEGLWDGRVIAKFMAEVVKLEESRAGKFVAECNDVVEEARCSDVLVLFHTERVGWGLLVCGRYCHESDGRLEIWEEEFLLSQE